MTTTKMISEDHARRLASCYHGYSSALDCDSTAAWGEQLIRIQAECGIEIVQTWMVIRAINRCRATLSKIESIDRELSATAEA